MDYDDYRDYDEERYLGTVCTVCDGEGIEYASPDDDLSLLNCGIGESYSTCCSACKGTGKRR